MSKKQVAAIGAAVPATIYQRNDLLLQLVTEIHQVVTKQMGGGLVGNDLPKPPRPTKKETAENPGAYYKTADDPLAGFAPVVDVIDLFSDKRYDVELGRDVSISGFVGGTLYEWATRDLQAFLAWFQMVHEGTPLNLSKLHPEQRFKMGIPG